MKLFKIIYLNGSVSYSMADSLDSVKSRYLEYSDIIQLIVEL